MRKISIHALREEGDGSPTRPTTTSSNFYPRPPRGGRPPFCVPPLLAIEFLSTPSARRATKAVHAASVTLAISIHALREEGDTSW